ncbi:MAG: hypothetical protein NW201_08540 [Gemmatimonadales bacterium]|nr:hypothetical protein [Gemmatimonadales bacterium]
MGEHDQVWGEARSERLRTLLRMLARLIGELDARGALLHGHPDLQRLIGEVRSELFHYEVRCTYDTPEVAEARRIVDEASRPFALDQDAPDDGETWRQGGDR